jgi:hypothetical protein
MKNLLLLSLSFLLYAGVSCNGQPRQKPVTEASATGDIEVYYFHLTTRCVTCRTVEAEAKKDLNMLYPDLMKDGKISFIALNLDEDQGKTVGEKLGVSGQTLLIVKGDKKINITNEGFLYAVSQPEKFKEVIKNKVDALINN